MLQLQRDLSLHLNTIADMDSALSVIIDYVRKIPSIDSGGIYLFDQKNEKLILRNHSGLSDSFVSHASEYSKETKHFEIVMSGKSIFTDYKTSGLSRFNELQKENIKALAIIPIHYNGTVIGALNVASHSIDEFTPTIKTSIEAIAAQMGSAIHRIYSEEEIHEHHKNLKELFDKINDFMFILDKTGRIIGTNTVTTRALGYSYEELIGTDIFFLHPKKRYTEAVEVFARMMEGKIALCTIPLVKKNGEEIPVETYIVDGVWSGNPAWFGVSRNISERINLERALKEGYDRLDLALMGANLGTWDWNIQTGSVVFSERWANMLGYDLDELEQDVSTWQRLMHPDDIPYVMSQLNEHLEGRIQFYETEHRLLAKDGSHKWIHDRGKVVEFDAHGKPLRAAGTHLDITHRKEIEQKLSFREKFENIVMIISTEFILLSSDEVDIKIEYALRVIGEFFNVARSYVFLFNDDMTVMSNTHEWCKRGVTPQKNILQNIPVSTVPWWMNKIKSGETLEILNVDELPAEAAAEKEILKQQDIKSLLSLPISHSLDVIGFIGFDSVDTYTTWDRENLNMLRVISEIFSHALIRKKYEETIKIARAEADRANHAKSEFLANMSHELRTPMTAIIGISKLLWTKSNENLSPDQNEGLKLIYDSGVKLLDLINDLLDLSKIEAGKMNVTLYSFPFSEVIEKTHGVFDPLFSGRNIAFIVESRNIPEYIVTDQTILMQILTNLIGNALKFTEKGSITLRVYSNDEKIYFEITDTGIGINESDLPNIFKQFSQLDSSISKKYRGTGLGLHLSKKFCELLSGSISIRSKIGIGTTITFYIPLVVGNTIEPVSGTTLSGPSAENPQCRNATVLIVDDDYSNRVTLRIMLEKIYIINVAETGERAIEIFDRVHPDIVLLDITMPDKSGFEIFDELRSRKCEKKPKIIAVTAHAMSSEKKQILSHGFDGYISKPVDSEILLQTIESLLTEEVKLS